MSLLAAFLLAAAPPPVPACDGPTVQAAISAALKARATDAVGARAAIAPAAACPAINGPTFTAHVLAAELAADASEWATVRSLLFPIGVHPEAPLGGRARLLMLRADQGLGDAAAFTRDRAIAIGADEAQLGAIGEKVETFRAGAASVTAFRAHFNQGGFDRLLVFSITPDDPALYPATIMLTDDKAAIAIMAEMKQPGASAHAWFIDLYTCAAHATLAPAGDPAGGEPPYAAVKAKVVAALTPAGSLAAAPPARGGCFGPQWLLPGFGQHR